MEEVAYSEGVFHDPGYIDWQKKRISFILELYGNNFFKGKKVLELACFEGGLSKMLVNLGANLTSVEGFQRNYEVCKQRYPEINFILKDLDVDRWDFDDHYDIIIHWGLLYHLRYPDVSLKHCINHCNFLLLESLVIDKKDIEILHVGERNIWGTDQSIHELGSRFSPSYVEDLLQGTSFKKI